MSKLFNRVKWLLILSGIASIGLNFTNPKIAKESLNTLASGVKAATEIKKHDPFADSSADDSEKLYVQIEGKLYEYNKSNIYTVNGMRMMYKNGQPRTRAQFERDAERAPPAVMHKTQQVTEMLENEPHMAYTPGGVQKIMDAAREAKAKIDKHNQDLNSLDE